MNLASSQVNVKKRFLFISWLLASFFLNTIFSNDILARILTPKAKLIDSIAQLNKYSSSNTTIIKSKSYTNQHNLVTN